MAAAERAQPSFTVTHDAEPSGTLVVGLSTFGLAGLTAVDFLVDQLELEQTGFVTADVLPTITPFEKGVPRRHTRLYSDPAVDLTILVNELFVPVWAAEPFANAVLDWTTANGVSEVCVLSGIPVPHGPDAHRVFYVASKDFREERLAETDIEPMGVGFLDGVNGSLMGRAIDSPLRTGVFITPVHAQAPDAEAALRLIDAVQHVYGIEVDTEPLQQFAGEIERYYRDLADRLETVQERHVPEDRMYM